MPVNYIEKETVLITKTEYQAPYKEKSNYLENVLIEGVNFVFDKNTKTYELEVPYTKKTLGISYKKEDEEAIVEVVGGENQDLVVGTNTIAVLVTSTEGKVREYDFIIKRSDDNSIVNNSKEDILNALNKEGISQITVEINDQDAVTLDKNLVESLKKSKKTLIFSWNDKSGNFFASLRIDGNDIKNESEINPNIKNNISNATLKKYLKDKKYTAFSTLNTNIPEKSIYKRAVSSGEDVYYLYHLEGKIMDNAPLRNNGGIVECEIKGEIDYALIGESNKPTKEYQGFSWLIPSIIITILFVIFLFISRRVMLRIVKNSHTSKSDEKNNSKKY